MLFRSPGSLTYVHPVSDIRLNTSSPVGDCVPKGSHCLAIFAHCSHVLKCVFPHLLVMRMRGKTNLCHPPDTKVGCIPGIRYNSCFFLVGGHFLAILGILAESKVRYRYSTELRTATKTVHTPLGVTAEVI